jgi:hypothetical protein
MAQPIYEVFLGRMTEAWYRLSQEEQNSLLDKVNGALEKVGGKRVVMCDSSWASEQWPFFGVEVFPDIEAKQKHARLLGELNWVRYVEDMTVLGTEWEEA